MNPFVEIVRPKTCLLVGIFVWLGSIIAGLNYGITVYASVISAMLVCAGGFVANDYIDKRKDNINKKHRPLPSGRMDEKHAIYYMITLFLVAFITSMAATSAVIVFVILNIFMVFLYSTHFRYYHLFGNFMRSYLLASAFLIGGAAAGNIFSVLFLAVFVLMANTAREITSDISTINSDRAYGKKTIPVIYGISQSRIVSTFFLLAAVFSLPMAFYYGLFGKFYMSIAVGSIIILLYSAYLNIKHKRSDKVGYEITWALVVGIIAFLTGGLI